MTYAKVYSFDVFDTCVTRVQAYPRDLFFELGIKLAPSNLGDRARHRFARRFQRARIRAEKFANWRTRLQHGGVDICAIYANFQWFFHSRLDVDTLVNAEILLEEESIYPIAETVAIINALRISGHRIVFISDMYISERLLTPILHKLGVMQNGDVLYVSCDSGRTKHSGELFEYVLRSENLKNDEIIHTGDNFHADIRMAERHGIRTRHFMNARLSRYEQAIAGSRLPRPTGKSFLAAFSRRTRLALENSPVAYRKCPLDEVIHSVIAPFLLSYVQWVLDDAAKRGIQRLYFVARDGEILHKIAKELNTYDIELRYLYGSRRAWLPPSITPDTPEWKRLLVVSGNPSTPHDITSRAGLNWDIQTELRNVLGMSELQWSATLNLDAARQFVANLLSNPRSAALVLASTKQKRDIALMYFQQEGLLDEASWALVDTGWSLNSQSALKRILESSGKSHQTPHGYYLGLARDHLNEDQAGKALAFTSTSGSIFARRRVIVEHSFLPSTHPSTISYTVLADRALPVLGNEERNNDELSYAHRLHEIILHAARLTAQNPGVRDAMRTFTPDIQQTAAYFIRNPRIEDARAMSSFGVTAEMRQERAFVEPLCRALSLLDVWKTLAMSLSKRQTFNAPAYMWLEGSIALSPVLVRLPLKLMLWLDELRNKLRSTAENLIHFLMRP